MATSEVIQNERAKRLMAMGEMAANLAHEIRNPLGSMELYCSLLKKDLESDSSSHQLAEHIHQGIRTLDRIITNCLQFTRDTTPKMSPNDTVSLIQRSVDTVRGQADNAGVEIEIQQLGEGVVLLDSFLLQQVLVNLLVNAIDAVSLDPGDVDTPTGRIRISSDFRDPSVWNLFILDNGNGIAQEALDSIFDPFYTTKERGTGLGLAIVHTIVTAHGGNISMKSRVGEGTTVQLSFAQEQKQSIKDNTEMLREAQQ